jgi:hypothetical protein
VSKGLTGDSAAGDTSPFAFTVNDAEGALPTTPGFTYAHGGVSCTNNGVGTGTANSPTQSVTLDLGAGDNGGGLPAARGDVNAYTDG